MGDVELRVEGGEVTGELALVVQPGQRARSLNAALDRALGVKLSDAATSLGVVVAAAPHAFAKPLPGRDAEGRVRYAVRGRREGDRLVPAHGAPKPKPPRR
ncbi:MAG TPA: hypothetical protein VFS43_18705 [Polyangiaceae bacterium]|nr:hypothetical protein [Polyangiaceae bacterium]